MNKETGEIRHKFMEAILTFQVPEDLSVDTAIGGMEFWLERFDKHGVLDMNCVELVVRPLTLHRIRLMSALLERGFKSSMMEPHFSYDLIVEDSKHDTIRVQIKTVTKSKTVSFTGGSRGGRDRTYKSNVKTYRQSTETSDIVVGVESIRNNGDTEVNYYFIPTLFIEKLGQGSLSMNKIPQAKNDWEILKRCKEPVFVFNKFGVSQ